MNKRLETGRRVPVRKLVTIKGGEFSVPDDARLVHLQFRRFAGCPVCNLHLRSFVSQHARIVAAGVREVVVFHSTVEDLLVHASALPFDVIADPGKRLYVEFGVESGLKAVLSPAAWAPILRAVAASLVRILVHRQPPPSNDPEGGRLGLPADFLIAADGEILACKYGEHVYDQWSVEEVEAFADQAAHR